MKRTTYISVAVLALIAAGVAPAVAGRLSTSTADPAANWVNAGAPTGPDGYLSTDWFTRGSEAATPGLTRAAAAKQAGFAFAARPDAAQSVIVQPNQLVTARGTFAGVTLRYADRIVLVINPTDVAFDADERVRTTDTTTTAGETKLWSKTSVRGNPAAFRKAATQKWESGVTNVMPAVLEWCEVGPDGTLIRYALLGEATRGELQAIAAQMN